MLCIRIDLFAKSSFLRKIIRKITREDSSLLVNNISNLFID